MQRATAPHVLASTLLVALALSACGKSSAPPVAPPIDPAHLRILGGVEGLPGLLEHAERGRDAMVAGLAAKFPALRAKLAEAQAAAGGDLGSNAGWEAAGLDPSGGLSVFVDDRLGDGGDDLKGGGWSPIVMVKVADRAKLFAAFKLTSDAPPADSAPSTVEVVRVAGEPRVLMATQGELTAFTLIGDREPRALEALRGRFQSVLAGGGELGDDANYRAALHGRSGPGIHLFVGPRGLDALTDLPFTSRRERRELRSVFGEQLAAVGLRVDPEGFVLRMVPHAAARALFEAAYRGTDDPPDLGTFVPAKGWVAVRASIDLEHSLPQLLGLMQLDESRSQSLMMAAGLSLGELTEALSGDFGVAFDLGNVARRLADDGVVSGASSANYVGMIGVRDESKADALLARLGGLLVERSRHGRRVATTIAELPGHVYQFGDETVAVVRRGRTILIAPSEMGLAAALGREASLAGTDAGKVLRKRSAFAVVAELSPLVQLVDGVAGREGDRDRFGFFAVLTSFTYLPAWKTFHDAPVVTVDVGWDGKAAVIDVRGGGIVYGYVAMALGNASQWAAFVSPVRARKSRELGTPGDAPHCATYLTKMRACVAEMPDDAGRAIGDGLKQTEDAWRSFEDKAALDDACKAALNAAKEGFAKTCPGVTWE